MDNHKNLIKIDSKDSKENEINVKEQGLFDSTLNAILLDEKKVYKNEFVSFENHSEQLFLKFNE